MFNIRTFVSVLYLQRLSLDPKAKRRVRKERRILYEKASAKVIHNVFPYPVSCPLLYCVSMRVDNQHCFQFVLRVLVSVSSH